MSSKGDIKKSLKTGGYAVIFWSSVDASMFMKAIINSIGEHGINVEHRFAISSGYYRKASSPFARMLLRCRMYIEYPIKLAWFCMINRKPIIHVVTTNTFYAPFISLLFSGGRQKVIHLVWDLFPDVLVQENRSKYGWTLRIIDSLIQYIISHVDVNVFLGRRLLDHATSRFRRMSRACIIPVGADADVFAGKPPLSVDPKDDINIVYCGNLGAMHDIKTLLEAINLSNGNYDLLSGLNLSFYASGSKYVKLKAEIINFKKGLKKPIILETPLNNKDWVLCMKKSHVSLVTLESGAENLVMPSKTYSAIAAGQAILAICALNSDLAELVIKNNCGWVVEPGNSEELKNILFEISSNRALLQLKRENAYRIGQNHYSNKNIAEAWVNLINDLQEN